MSYKVESEFDYLGLKCAVVMTSMGHRCGYVGIDKQHPLYGVDYSDKSDLLKTNDIEEISVENAGLGQLINRLTGEYEKESISPEMYFSVHGGITYSGGGINSTYPIKSDLWWFGYDCAHSGDAKDIDSIENETLKDIELQYSHYGIVRTKEYCIEQCKHLAEQLVKIHN